MKEYFYEKNKREEIQKHDYPSQLKPKAREINKEQKRERFQVCIFCLNFEFLRFYSPPHQSSNHEEDFIIMMIIVCCCQTNFQIFNFCFVYGPDNLYGRKNQFFLCNSKKNHFPTLIVVILFIFFLFLFFLLGKA